MSESRKWCLPLALLLLVGCVRLDMYDQAHHEPLEGSEAFADGRASRPYVEGTVARGALHADRQFYTGMEGTSAFSNDFPFVLSQELLDRGRQRYDIFCSLCHDRVGGGRGMVVQRGFKQPESLHIKRLREMPVGYFFDVITNGFSTMPAYRAQISAEDRWAIVAYIRALQLSQHTVLRDLSSQEANEIRRAAEQAQTETASSGHVQSEEHH